MKWYHELCIYAACGVLTASAMRVWCKEGEIGTFETLAVGIFWPIFAMLLVAAFIIKNIEKMKKKNCINCKFYELIEPTAVMSHYEYNCKIKGIINPFDLFRNECREFSRKSTRQIERQLEEKCVAWARTHGWDVWKNENNGNTGIPDRSFLKGDRFIMIEFKASATARVRPEQIRWQERHPGTIYFVHDFLTFTKILE